MGGCYGGATMGGCYGGTPVYGAPVIGGGTGGTGESKPKMEKGGNQDEGESRLNTPQPARIVVTLPADATLTVDDTPTVSTGTRRVFVSPSLPPDRDYHYTLKAEVVRDGKKIPVTERVAIRGGQETQVNLNVPASGVARR